MTSGTQINQHQARLTGTPTSGTQTLKVEASRRHVLHEHRRRPQLLRRAARASGIGIDVDVINKHVSATIQEPDDDHDAAAGSTSTRRRPRTSTSSRSTSARSTDNAAVDGSVIVVVLSPSNTLGRGQRHRARRRLVQHHRFRLDDRSAARRRRRPSAPRRQASPSRSIVIDRHGHGRRGRRRELEPAGDRRHGPDGVSDAERETST